MHETLINLSSNQWLINIGKPTELDMHLRYVEVQSLEETLKNLESLRWENATLEAINLLSWYLHSHHREEHNRWNEYITEGKSFLTENIESTLIGVQQSLGLNQSILDSIKFDILGAYMESAYSDLNHGSTFFSELIKVYVAGHIPCGWKGKYTKGYLLVY